MTGWLLAVAVASVRRWTWLYTCLLAPSTRQARRREMSSDLWEFQTDPDHAHRSVRPAIHLMMRAVLGVPDDVGWACQQFAAAGTPLRLSSAIRLAIIAVAASTLVVSASSPSVDVSQSLRVNMLSAGWVRVTTGRTARTVPTLALTLTNAGHRAIGPVQINAVFRERGNGRHLGNGFSWGIGSEGLAAGATSRPLLVRPQTGFWNVDASRPVIEAAGPLMAGATVTLIVKHDGRWTSLGDFRIGN